MDKKTPRPPQGPAGPKLSEIADAAGVGVERRILVTVYDTLVRPGRAAQAAFDGADSHISQLKLFAVLAGLLFGAAALLGAPMTLTVEALVTPAGTDAAQAYITGQGVDPASVDAALSRWLGMLLWPIMIIGSLIYIVALKLVRPSITWWGHALVYLIATNAMTLVSIPLAAGRLVSLELFYLLQLLVIVVFFVQMLRLGGSVLRLGAGRLVLLFVLSIIATVPAMLITTILQVTAAWLILDQLGLSILDLMEAAQPALITGDVL
jgi:hypothetical protein